jgi:hypothetical protein
MLDLIQELEVRIRLPPAERCYGAGGEDGNFVAYINRWSAAMPQPNDLSRSLVALDQDSTIIAVVELSQSSWLVGGILPGIERQPRKKLEPSPERLLALLHRWRDESVRAGRSITRIAVAFEAGPRLAQSKPPTGKGLRDLNHQCHNLDLHRFHTASHQEIGGRIVQPMRL